MTFEITLAPIRRAGAAPGKHMGVNVDQPRRYIQPRCVDHLGGLRGGDIGAHRGYSVPFNGYVANGVDTIFRIDDVAAFQKQVILLREGGNNAEP